MIRRVALTAIAYLVPTFALGFVWHLIAFKSYYDALAMYRHDVIIPFGLLSMGVQATLFAWLLAAGHFGGASFPARATRFALFGFFLSWSFTTIAVAAKNVMTSVPNYVLIETAFTAAQWAMVGPMMVLVHSKLSARPTHHAA